jgi:pyruvate formate lyase activating enzyme
VGIIIIKGLVFDIKKFAVDDGPGIRTTLFLKGCPMRCLWCHNPEGQESLPELMYMHKKCNICGECVGMCPSQALFSTRKELGINRKICSVCGVCAEKCPSGALKIVGKKTSVEEVMKEIGKDSAFYEESGGGVTLSGGEPLWQIDFTSAILRECKELNIHTAVDTCGYASCKAIERIKDKVDLFLYDLKIMNDEKHRKYTGKSNKQILRNFKTLADNGNDLLVRLPVIPGINDDRKNIQMAADFVLLYGVKRVCLLPYHRAGIEKYRSLGKRYNLNSIRTPSEPKLNAIKEQLEASGLMVKIGG